MGSADGEFKTRLEAVIRRAETRCRRLDERIVGVTSFARGNPAERVTFIIPGTKKVRPVTLFSLIVTPETIRGRLRVVSDGWYGSVAQTYQRDVDAQHIAPGGSRRPV